MPTENKDILNSEENHRIWLIVVAAPRELDAAIGAFGFVGQRPLLWERTEITLKNEVRLDLVWSGVGKANASGAIARVLDPARHIGVLSIGIAGALPGSECTIGDVVCASESVFADEGVQREDGFISCAKMGFAPFDSGSDSIIHDARVVELFAEGADHIGPIACVSSCSGTDSGARSIVARTGAIAEAMEGAAACLSAHRVDKGLLSAELRVISNTTGDREAQQWDLDGALEKLGIVLGRLAKRL